MTTKQTLTQEEIDQYHTIASSMLEKAIEYQADIKRMIAYTLRSKFPMTSTSRIEVDDVYQKLTLSIIEYPDRIGKRFARWNWNVTINGKESFSLHGFKILAIDSIISLFRQTRLLSGMPKTGKRSKPTHIEEIETIEEDGITYLPYMPDESGMGEGSTWIKPPAYTPIESIPHERFRPSFLDSILTDIQRIIPDSLDQEILSLRLQGYTIAEISQKVEIPSVQYKLKNIEKKISAYISDNDIDNELEAYFHVRKQLIHTREKMRVTRRELPMQESLSLYRDLASMEAHAHTPRN